MILGIYGGGGLGREVLELANDVNKGNSLWSEIVFIDDKKTYELVNNTKVFTFEEIHDQFSTNNLEIVIAIGEPETRLLLRHKVESFGFRLTILVHPTSKINSTAQIGNGTIICYGCFISCNVKIGDNVYIQPNACVGHDTVINNNSLISSNVCVAGGCSIGSETYIGMNVPVREHVNIGSKAIIGMGSVVYQDVSDEVIVLGNPARVMKKNENHKVFK